MRFWTMNEACSHASYVLDRDVTDVKWFRDSSGRFVIHTVRIGDAYVDLRSGELMEFEKFTDEMGQFVIVPNLDVISMTEVYLRDRWSVVDFRDLSVEAVPDGLSVRVGQVDFGEGLNDVAADSGLGPNLSWFFEQSLAPWFGEDFASMAQFVTESLHGGS